MPDLTLIQWVGLLGGPLGALAVGAIFDQRFQRLAETTKPNQHVLTALEKLKAETLKDAANATENAVRAGLNAAIQDGRPIVLNLAAAQTQGIVEHAIRAEREHLADRFASKIDVAEIKVQLHHVADEMKKFGEEMKGYDAKLDKILDALLKR